MVQHPATGEVHSHMCCAPPSRISFATACANVHKSNPGRVPKPCAMNHNNINADPLPTASVCTGVSSLAVNEFKIVYTAMDKSCVRIIFKPVRAGGFLPLSPLSLSLARSLSLSLCLSVSLSLCLFISRVARTAHIARIHCRSTQMGRTSSSTRTAA